MSHRQYAATMKPSERQNLPSILRYSLQALLPIQKGKSIVLSMGVWQYMMLKTDALQAPENRNDSKPLCTVTVTNGRRSVDCRHENLRKWVL